MLVNILIDQLLLFLWKIALKTEKDVPVLRRQANPISDVKRVKKTQFRQLFASPYPISEYMDNISRVGQVIMNKKLHNHSSCTKKKCEHPFVVDLLKDPTRNTKCKRS